MRDYALWKLFNRIIKSIMYRIKVSQNHFQPMQHREEDAEAGGVTGHSKTIVRSLDQIGRNVALPKASSTSVADLAEIWVQSPRKISIFTI